MPRISGKKFPRMEDCSDRAEAVVRKVLAVGLQ